MDKKLFGPAEIGLLIGIIILTLTGVVYAGVSGVITLPGVPAFLADQNISRPRPTIVNFPSPSPSLTSNSSPLPATVTSPAASPVSSPSPVPSSSTSPQISPQISPSTSPSQSPSPSPKQSPTPTPQAFPTQAKSPTPSPKTTPTPVKSPSPSPTPDEKAAMKKRDEQRKTDLATLQVAVEQYKKAKKSYPKSPTFTDSKTYLASSPLAILVPGYILGLPVDPNNPKRWYGYKSLDGKTYELTANLEDTTDPSGAFPADGNNVYLYTLRNQ